MKPLCCPLSVVLSPLKTSPPPSPKTGEVFVRVAACGVCHTDLHVVKGEVKFPLPCVLGHEISGVVEAVAPDVQTARRETGGLQFHHALWYMPLLRARA